MYYQDYGILGELTLHSLPLDIHTQHVCNLSKLPILHQWQDFCMIHVHANILFHGNITESNHPNNKTSNSTNTNITALI